MGSLGKVTRVFCIFRLVATTQALVLAMIILLGYGKALAWAELGHEVTGEIAEQLISKDPKLKKAIQAINGIEPLAISAYWPDKVRSDGRYDDFAPYHYITFFTDPYKHTEKDSWTVINEYPKILVDPKAPREAKMIAFKYLIHVLGDIQQPLHAGHEFDRGGNSCIVKWQPDPSQPATESNLHKVWDEDIVTVLRDRMKEQQRSTEKYYGYKQVSIGLMDKYKTLIAKHEAMPIDVAAWVTESEKLRKSSVYPDNLADDKRPYCLKDRNLILPGDKPTLGVPYIDKSLPIAEERIVLGGVRIAAFLKNVFKNSSGGPDEQLVLNSLKLKNPEKKGTRVNKK